jgi:geranylgeranyl diphosphate synthase, type I
VVEAQLAAARDRLLPPVEAHLQGFLDGRGNRAPSHYGMMRYHLGWVDAQLTPATGPVGKRLRPLICLLAAEACGGEAERALPAAIALELLHNFTLIHDDIEDGDAMRHHRPTLWKLWGEPQAINAGDGMHVLAHLALLDLAETGVDTPRIVKLTGQLAETSLIITEGQHLDLAFERRTDVTPAEYLDMIGRKSAALIACSASMGAEVAGADGEVRQALHAFGFELGMGFQIRDDVLGIWGRSETTGKPAGDLRRRKKTLPSLYALARTSGEDHAHLARLFVEAPDGPPDEALVEDCLAVLNRHGARTHCEQMVARYSTSAASYLDQVPAAPARESLHALIAQLETRDY